MNTQITCPKCKAKINVGQQLEKNYQDKLELKLKQEIDKKLSSERKKYQQQIQEELREQNLDEINNLKHQLKEKLKKTKEQASEKEFKILELEKRLADQKKLTNEMKRKQDMIPQQLQGEIGELAIESYLKSKFTSDKTTSIKKGSKGADCIFEIFESDKSCGKIYIESKKTIRFNSEWLIKLKKDSKEIDADIAVLVTDSLPEGMERFGIINGIIICQYEDFKSLVSLLRNQLVSISKSTAPQVNRESKVERLYTYLTSNKFRMQFEAIVECYQEMKVQLDKEKSIFHKIWKTREGQIETLSINTSEIYGSIKGISGNAVQDIASLGFVDSNSLNYEND